MGPSYSCWSFPSFLDAPFTALYDSSSVNVANPQTYSTLLLMPPLLDTIYSSTNLGANWTIVGYAPWAASKELNFLLI